MNADPHGTAFPVNSYILPNGQVEHPQYGMTQRTYIAALCMQGFLARPEEPEGVGFSVFAAMAVDAADALISELN